MQRALRFKWFNSTICTLWYAKINKKLCECEVGKDKSVQNVAVLASQGSLSGDSDPVDLYGTFPVAAVRSMTDMGFQGSITRI